MVYWKIDSYLTVRVLENRLLFNSTCTGKYPLPFKSTKTSNFRFRSYFQQALCCYDPILGHQRLSRHFSRRYSEYSDCRRSSFVPQYSHTRDTSIRMSRRVVVSRSTTRRGEQVYRWRNELPVPNIHIGQELCEAETAFR